MLPSLFEQLRGVNSGADNTTKYLKDLGVQISGMDLSEKILEDTRASHPGLGYENRRAYVFVAMPTG